MIGCVCVCVCVQDRSYSRNKCKKIYLCYLLMVDYTEHILMYFHVNYIKSEVIHDDYKN